MSFATRFNYPVWCTRDTLTNPPHTTRAARGLLVETVNHNLFTEEITCVFSFVIRTNWSAVGSETNASHQGLYSLGAQANGLPFSAAIVYGGGNKYLQLYSTDQSNAASVRYHVYIGDEDGVSWLQDNKAYHVAISISNTAYSVAVNGESSPKLSVATNAPGALNANWGTDRMWHHGPNAAYGSSPLSTTVWGPSVYMGPMALTPNYYDWSLAANLDKVFDSSEDGWFINPGENGSLWFNSSYTTTPNFHPYIYWPTGGPLVDNGSQNVAWTLQPFGTSGQWNAPGGLIKQFVTAP